MNNIFNRYIVFISLVLTFSILLTSCQYNLDTDKQKANSDSQQEQTTQNNQSLVNLKYNENFVKNAEYKVIKKGREIKTYHFSANEDYSFLETKDSVIDLDGPSTNVILYVTNLKPNITGTVIQEYWERYKLRENRTLETVQWINNEEAIIRDWRHFEIYIYNTRTGEKKHIASTSEKPLKETFGIPVDIMDYDYNIDLNKLVVTSSGEKNYVHLLNLEDNNWEQIYESSTLKQNLNVWIVKAQWDDKNNIYFDAIIDDGEQIIKKYNYSTKEIIDYAKNSYLLNTSPDKRFITYVDKTKNITVIRDPYKNINIEIPMTEELTWNNNTEFVTVEDNRYVDVYKIDTEEDCVNIEKYNISNLLGEDEYIYNVQYVKNKLRFDIVNLSFDDNIAFISNVVTYEVESK